MKEKICAVVVTYNRKDLLLECLNALRNQTHSLDGIYLIDNASTDGTQELLMKDGWIAEIVSNKSNEPIEKIFMPNNDKLIFYYVRMHEDTGGSGGFHEGVKRAYEKGYDWLWLMDDDAEAKEDALENLLKFLYEKNLVALASLEVDLNNKVIHPQRGYFNFKNVYKGIVIPFDEKKMLKNCYLEIDHASFVGILIKSCVISEIGLPKKEFFIHYDDVEYCIRLRKVGKILLIPNSIIFHKEKMLKSGMLKNFLGRNSLRFPFEEFWLTYYGQRNLVWLGKKYSTNKLRFYLDMIKNLIKNILGVLIFDDNKVKCIIFIINAYIDGLKGDFDNDKPKRILYR